MPEKLPQVAMIQMIEELPDIHLQNVATLQVRRLLPERLQRFVCRSFGPEAVRAVQKVVLVNRLQQHDDRPLEDLVLQTGNSGTDRRLVGASLGLRVALRNVHSPDRRCLVRAGLYAVEQPLEVPQQVLLVFGRGYSVYALGSVLPGAPIRFDQPVEVHQVGQRSECGHRPQVGPRRLSRQLRYPLLFRGHGCRISMHSSCFSKTGP